jgi:hypothetical protein
MLYTAQRRSKKEKKGNLIYSFLLIFVCVCISSAYTQQKQQRAAGAIHSIFCINICVSVDTAVYIYSLYYLGEAYIFSLDC